MNIAIILAGGTGSRLGNAIPKQYLEVHGKPIIGYCIDTFLAHPMIDAMQIVADKEWHDKIKQYMGNWTGKNTCGNRDIGLKWKGFSMPGRNRQLSIFNAIDDVFKYATEDDYIMIHDAARPLLHGELITECLEKAKTCDGILPVIPMKDTVYYSEDGCGISALLNREKIFAGQAPEVFLLGKYYEANKKLLPDRILEINGSTEPAILAGMDIKMISGDEENIKITTEADLEQFKAKLENR